MKKKTAAKKTTAKAKPAKPPRASADRASHHVSVSQTALRGRFAAGVDLTKISSCAPLAPGPRAPYLTAIGLSSPRERPSVVPSSLRAMAPGESGHGSTSAALAFMFLAHRPASHPPLAVVVAD